MKQNSFGDGQDSALIHSFGFENGDGEGDVNGWGYGIGDGVGSGGIFGSGDYFDGTNK